MNLLVKLFISFATSAITLPISQEILKLSKNFSYVLGLILFFSIYFIGSEIGLWQDIILNHQ